MSATVVELNHRERATLKAVARDTAELTCSVEPDLFIDGLAFCDQNTAHLLVRRGFIVAERAGRAGERVPARLTDAGLAAIGLPAASQAA